MIGVGIFTSLGFQVQEITSPFVILVLWLVGGIVALCGAFCYAELAVMFPRSSGEYSFLTRAFSPPMGFMAGWLSATVGFAAPVALAAMAFGDYAKPFAPAASPVMLGLGVIWGVSLFHLVGIRQGGMFQIASTALKIALIVAFLVAGFFTGGNEPISFLPAAPELRQIVSPPFAISLVFVMYAYSGWNAATYIATEVIDPQRNLPRALLIGTAIVILLYVALNAVFLRAAPIAELAGQVNVAQIAATHIFGSDGAKLVSALISIGLVSSVSAMMWIGPRVTMMMGEDQPALRFFSRRSPTGVPRAALLFQLCVSSALLLTQSFEAVLKFIQFGLAFCSFLTVLGMVRLRFTRPDLPRSYRAWGYPFSPLAFMAATLLMMFYLLITLPLQSIAGLLLLLVGVVLYEIINMQQTSSRKTATRIGLFAVVLCAGGAFAQRAEAATPDETARFLAGMTVPTGSSLAPLAATPRWRAHAGNFDAAFKRVEDRQLSKIRVWAQKNVTEKQPTLFYMFSGPDFLYANSFFPDSSTYVLAGLEPVGDIPDLSKLPPGAVFNVLHSLEASLRSVLNVSFFKTIDMRAQFRATPVRGALPVLYVFLARSGKTIQDVSLVRLNENGEISAESKPDGKGGAIGAKIAFSSPGGPQQVLYYFSTDLSNAGFKKQGLEPFMMKLGEGSSLIKSASYLLHGGNFAQVRNFLLTRSVAILEDDTGVPAAQFGPEWRLNTYGQYLRPIAIFSRAYQPKLAHLFKAQPYRALPFGMGYHWRPNQSNVVYAVKASGEPKLKESPPGTPAIAPAQNPAQTK